MRLSAKPGDWQNLAVIEIDWFLPTGGDSRDVLPGSGGAHRRRPDHAYLAQVAQACDQLGFEAVLTPCGTGCEDAWVATASLMPLTRHLKFLVAFRPTLLTPTLAAQMASTYQRMSGGRLLINIDPKGNVSRCTETLDETAGNILTEDVFRIRERLREMQRRRPCAQCWTSCRGFAESMTMRPRLRQFREFFHTVKPHP